MSDPMNRPNDSPSDRVVTPPPESQPRKSASPLVWVLLLIAVLALGWYAYNSYQVGNTVPDAVPPPAADRTAIDDASSDSALVKADGVAARKSKPASAIRHSTPARSTVGDRVAQPIARLQPDYPRSAFRAGEEGIVLVRAQVDANGVPTQVEVADRSGSRELDRSAVEAVRKWRFTPAMEDGRRVASTVQVPIEFRRERQ